MKLLVANKPRNVRAFNLNFEILLLDFFFNYKILFYFQSFPIRDNFIHSIFMLLRIIIYFPLV